jgi:pimeloyl-ACP methyl ester carboxylesterase
MPRSIVPPFRPVALAAAVFLLVACDGAEPTALPRTGSTGAAATDVVTSPADGPWLRIIEGSTGPGSSYALLVPREWNGDAVYYAHGFRDASSPVDLRDQDQLFALRDMLGERGYAVAYSSFSANGFVVKDGAQRTHQLRGLLSAALGGQPARSYLAGHSLGGGIALALAEAYPEQYDGALLVCGMVGGSQLQTQYLGHVRALADVFFPGRFPGDAVGVPEGTVITQQQVIAAVASNPAGLFAIASAAQTPLPFVPIGNVMDQASPAFQTMVGSLFAALSFHARGINDVVGLVHGKSPFGNDGSVYGLGPNPVLPGLGGLLAFADANARRYAIDRPAAEYLERHFEPTGALLMPVLTLHNAWDPAVPLFHERALLERVTAAGRGASLLQRTVSTYGHCAIGAAQAAQSFDDLTTWASSGVKPAN